MFKIFTLILLGFSLPAFSQDGSLDPTFGTNGKAYATTMNLNQSLSKTVVQSNGKVVVSGKAANCCGYDFSVARFNSNGTVDNTFDGDGVVTTDFGSNAWDIANTVAVQPDGKIIAAGISNQQFALARYNVDGSLDNTFNGNGKVITQIGSYSEIFSILLLPDGKILAGGTSFSGTNRFTMARYLPDGSPDASFGTGGISATTILSGVQIIYSLARQADGKIVAAGNINNDFAFTRYTANGTLDPTFGFSGHFTTNFLGNEIAYSVAVQPDGKIIAAGVKDLEVLIMRVNANGSHDNSFDTDGIIKTNYSTTGDAFYSILIQGDNKIVAAGTSFEGGSSNHLLVRYLQNGALDPTFGTGGVLKLDMGSSEAFATVAGWNNTLVVGGQSSGMWSVARLANSSYQFVLPLQLKSFTGRLQNGTVKLAWTTGSESNTASFYIERSTDGNSYSRVGEVAAAGNSTTDRAYQFSDNSPLPGTSHYRLKTVDIDGKTSFSPSIMIRNGKMETMVIFQNPVSTELRIQVSLPDGGKISIVNSAGAVVKQQTAVAGISSLAIPVGDLPPGAYWVLAPSKEGIQRARFVKQ
jgi:uncharacterized delta-60 repeat protein